MSHGKQYKNKMKSFRGQSSNKQSAGGGRKISSVRNGWKQQETKIEQNCTKKPAPPTKVNIYSNLPDQTSQQWLNTQLKSDYKPA